MILSGLWHGAAWKYVIWGAFVGVLLALSHATVAARDRIYELARVPAVVKRTVRIFITFHLVCVCWVIFRANTMSDAMHVFASFVHPDWGRPPFIPVRLGIYCLIAVLVLVPIQIVQERKGSIRELLARQPAPVRWAAWYALLALTVLLGVEGGSQFVYFQF
jgi:hypothetical protein